jgi:hypothetical protein
VEQLEDVVGGAPLRPFPVHLVQAPQEEAPRAPGFFGLAVDAVARSAYTGSGIVFAWRRSHALFCYGASQPFGL